MNDLQSLQNDLNKLKNPVKQKVFLRFFKTGKGEYGEGDQFLGLTVPQQRAIAKKYQDLSFNALQKLLNNKIHEYRLVALLILVASFNKAGELDRKRIVDFYLKNTRNINNWDLVDLSSYHILGVYLLDKDRSVLYKLARSKDLWEKRIAMISTFTFIKQNQFKDTLKLAKILLHDKHDLIHKAVGWMLREVGKRDQKLEEEFLQKYYKTMPRTMLRYAIEKFNPKKRQYFLQK